MSIDDVTAIASDALFLVIKVSAPILLVSLIVGLIISIFQTVTSIQEQTLTFVPKIIAIFLTLILVHYRAGKLDAYADNRIYEQTVV